MNKRGAGIGFGNGEERYGGQQAQEQEDERPAKATAAQMAKRKYVLHRDTAIEPLGCSRASKRPSVVDGLRLRHALSMA